jgi:hypothetical protein
MSSLSNTHSTAMVTVAQAAHDHDTCLQQGNNNGSWLAARRLAQKPDAMHSLKHGLVMLQHAAHAWEGVADHCCSTLHTDGLTPQSLTSISVHAIHSTQPQAQYSRQCLTTER